MVKHVFDAGGPPNPPNWDPQKYGYEVFVKEYHIKSINILSRAILKFTHRHHVEFGAIQKNETYAEFVDSVLDNIDFCVERKLKGRVVFDDRNSAIFMFTHKKDALLFRLRLNRNNGHTKSSF